jgi:uncharacterized protein YbaR (Trm112 family)
MDLTLVERLVCPEVHATTPLVVRVDAAESGRVRAGMLGCPACHREWPIEHFAARFGPPADLPASAPMDGHAAAALLNLTAPGIVIADGASAEMIRILVSSYEASVVALDDESPDASALLTGAQRVPLAPGVATGALLFRQRRTAAFIASVASAVAPWGRVIAAHGVAADARLREIARDESVAVLAREPDAVRVELTKRRND